MPLVTVDEALQYIDDRIALIRIDALVVRDLADALFVWRTNERTTAGDQLLVEACNEHAAQMKRISHV